MPDSGPFCSLNGAGTIRSEKNFSHSCKIFSPARSYWQKGGGAVSELAEIYRIYFDDVYRYLLALSHDAQLAEELTSETFCRAMRALPGFRGACDIRV